MRLQNGTSCFVIWKTVSVQFSRSVMSDSLRPHESQHARPPCPSPTPSVHSNSCPSSRWCHPAISSSVVLFSSCAQSLPASGSFPMSQFFAWGGLSIGVSALASVLPMNTQDWSPLEWTGWISLQSKGVKKLKHRVILRSSNFTPSIYLGKLKIYMHTKTCTYTQTGIHNNQKAETTQMSSNCWMVRKTWYIDSMEYCSAIKNELLTFATTWMNWEIIIASEVSQKERQPKHNLGISRWK